MPRCSTRKASFATSAVAGARPLVIRLLLRRRFGRERPLLADPAGARGRGCYRPERGLPRDGGTAPTTPPARRRLGRWSNHSRTCWPGPTAPATRSGNCSSSSPPSGRPSRRRPPRRTRRSRACARRFARPRRRCARPARPKPASTSPVRCGPPPTCSPGRAEPLPGRRGSGAAAPPSALPGAVELERVPATTSVLASYEAELDEEGTLLGYGRLRRYYRNQADPE
ncbi:hypothetical protein GHK86_10985 [Acidimicrobiaceae bacterium USS-CC1]|uniref:Uncharacterized protein n=1 Tax=Acidiferrimicrobium australe TaxID=2664430 RepID=A0ABW9QTR2_9ACTN|nr:hypothetical protein [Acidiferrimicrobium australe]